MMVSMGAEDVESCIESLFQIFAMNDELETERFINLLHCIVPRENLNEPARAVVQLAQELRGVTAVTFDAVRGRF